MINSYWVGAGRQAGGESVAAAPVFGGAALAQPGGERGAAGGPVVERRGDQPGNDECLKHESPHQTRSPA
jgi:hypothetical protein